MTFKLVKHSSNKARTTFQILNGAGDICGSVNVKPEEADDLVKYWRGGVGAPSTKPNVPRLALPRMSRQAILRGC